MRDVYLYGTIGSWFYDGNTSSWLLGQLRDCGGEDVTLHINSDGGDVFEAVAMQAAIRAHPGRVTAVVEGLAASAATVVMAAAGSWSTTHGARCRAGPRRCARPPTCSTRSGTP